MKVTKVLFRQIFGNTKISVTTVMYFILNNIKI